ncbi:MAG: PadR family transcriptional regulator [Candidatus Bathyarchaeota archaeon]|nr:PadR family transcriptional regulator [Candidatus Bathyarchaeota archaeon]
MSTCGKGNTVGVPRGLLRFLVLKMLSEKPMSGGEIIKEIEMQTGSWKPSPGSIYPLLAWMLKKGFTKELPKDELGFKRYSFTEEGSRFLEKQIALGKDFMKKMEFLAPMLVGGFNLGGNNKKLRNLGEAAKRLIKLFIFLRQNLDRVSERDAEELTEILRNCSEKFEKIVQRIKDEN